MKNLLILITFCLPIVLSGQVPSKYDYPDTLWVYGEATDPEYGLTPEKPIKVGGGLLPKHGYRYLNSLSDTNGNKVTYKRIGSCCSEEIGRAKPLIAFQVFSNNKEYRLYFDHYEWDDPKIISGFDWQESRSGYYGEYKNDTIFHGYGLYFFEDGGYYKGNFDNGIMSGQGEMSIPDQERYIGEFKDGKYDGSGTLFYPDGGKYVGEWEKGVKQGNGRIYYPPDSEIEFIEGVFKDDAPTGTFEVVKRDGTKETHDF